jgi:hypothetical protein
MVEKWGCEKELRGEWIEMVSCLERGRKKSEKREGRKILQ